MSALVPGLEQALRDGRTTPAHVHTLSAVLCRMPGEQRHLVATRATRLVDAACTSSPQRLTRTARAVVSEVCREPPPARRCRQRRASFVCTWTDAASGMTVIHGEIDPITGLRLAGALESAIEDRYRGRVPDELLDHDTSRDHLRARALVALIRTARRHRNGHGRRREHLPHAQGPHPPGSPNPESMPHQGRTAAGTPRSDGRTGRHERPDRAAATTSLGRSHPTRAP
jgi:hypothetical protein